MSNPVILSTAVTVGTELLNQWSTPSQQSQLILSLDCLLTSGLQTSPESQTLCGSSQLFTLPMATSMVQTVGVLFQSGQQNRLGNTTLTVMNVAATQTQRKPSERIMMTSKNLNDLKNTKNESEWNAVCDLIKREHGGYPADWYEKVILSGLMAQVSMGWRR